MTWSVDEERRFTGVEEVLGRIDVSLHGDDRDNDDQGLVGRVKANSHYRVRLQSIHSKIIKYTLGFVPLFLTGYITYLKSKWFGGMK